MMNGPKIESHAASSGEPIAPDDSRNEAHIVDAASNPRIKGTRITVYAVLEYLQAGWQRDEIARLFRLEPHQVEAAIHYIETHKEEVTAEFNKIMARIARGNPPELQARLDAIKGSARARLEELRRSRSQESANERHSGG
jgi:uncharacterized protein (DUF433 family)